MSKPKICAKWIVYNGADTIAQSIASAFEFADEFVVVDGNLRSGRTSNDGTWEIVEAIMQNVRGVGKRFVHSHGLGKLYHEQHNISLALMDTAVDWVLQLDHDEVFLPSELATAMPWFESDADGIGFQWPFVTFLDPQTKRFSGPSPDANLPDATMRAYRNSPGLKFVCTNGIAEAPVDDRGTIQCVERKIQYPKPIPRLWHYHCFETPARFLDKHLFYRSAEDGDWRKILEEETANMLKHFDPDNHIPLVERHPLIDPGLNQLATDLSDGICPVYA